MAEQRATAATDKVQEAMVVPAADRPTLKSIKVNLDKCIGCRACELACSGYHAIPKYSSVNPERSRIRVVVDELKDVYVPIRAGDYTPAECTGRHSYVIDGKEFPECSFCNVSCPARDLFREPESGLPLTCDLCSDDPTLEEPLCVQVCRCGALSYHSLGEKLPESGEPYDEVTVGLQSLVARFGLSRVADKVADLSKRGR